MAVTKIVLNNSEFVISGYSRYTSIENGIIRSNANVAFKNISDYDALTALAELVITSLQISVDGETVYSLSNQHARITNINENLYDSGMSMQVTIVFDSAVDE